MNYKEKFEDFLNRMTGLLDEANKKGHIVVRVEDLENAFPELKESEDEKWIPKEIAKYLKEKGDFRSCWLAWLEKQGEKDSQIKLPMFTFDDILALQCCMETVKKVQKDKDLYEKLNDLHGRVYDAYHFEKGEVFDKIVERARTGKQRVLVTESDGVANIDWDTRSLQDTKLLMEYGLNYIKKIESKGEQKPTDKVETKFHEGDWVILTAGELSTTLQIAKVDTNKKLYWFNDSSYLPIVDEECLHFWTIQDAKDGDVLDANGAPFIYKKHNKDYVYCYCGVNLSGDFIEAKGFDTWNLNSKVYPAAKEQRNLLFQKMKKAGYTWDAEKKELKELKKVESKPVTDFSDIKTWKYIVDAVLTKEYGIGNYLNSARTETIAKELQERFGKNEQKPAWSEEDEKNTACYNPYKAVVESIAEMCKHYDKTSHSGLRDFYDNVKVKCKDAKEYDSLFSQSTWKPSDEQIIEEYGAAVKSLYQDLKKLREKQ